MYSSTFSDDVSEIDINISQKELITLEIDSAADDSVHRNNRLHQFGDVPDRSNRSRESKVNKLKLLLTLVIP